MEILQATKDKLGLISSKRFTTFSVVIFIAFPVVIVVTSMCRNPSFAIFEGFSKAKALQNVTANGLPLERRIKNMTYDENFGKERDNINTMSEVLKGKIQNGTAAEGKTTEAGSKSASFASSTNKSSTHSENLDDKLLGSKSASFASSTNESSTHSENLDDKRLGGLLASGFDETSCISRLQSHQYRKASPHKPNPYLISKLRNYEIIHRRCGPNSRAYNRNMVKIARSKNHGNAAKCKYLVWRPVNGLGNQMISMVATFLYALLTDRVLLVRFGKDKNGLFCEPFLNSTWILPKNSPFWDEKHVETYQTMIGKDKANNSKEDIPSVLFLNLQHTHNDPEKLFHCDHSQDLLQKVHLLIFQSDQYFVPSLFMTPSFNLEITKMFPEKDTVFYHLGRYLFHPSNKAWGLISRFYQAYLAKADEKIGLQIRVFSPATTPHQAFMDLLLSCTIRNKILPQVDVQNSVASTWKNQTLKAVIVASLYPHYAENLRAMYLNNPTVNGEVVRVYQPSHEEHQKYGDNMQNMKAWTEMYLLSLCDVLVTTSLSTFGYVAQGLGGLKAWQLFKLVTNETHFPPCKRDFSMEPCYHVPPKHHCNGKPIEDFFSSFLHVKKCKDYRSGVKLFNSSTWI